MTAYCIPSAVDIFAEWLNAVREFSRAFGCQGTVSVLPVFELTTKIVSERKDLFPSVVEAWLRDFTRCQSDAAASKKKPLSGWFVNEKMLVEKKMLSEMKGLESMAALGFGNAASIILRVCMNRNMLKEQEYSVISNEMAKYIASRCAHLGL